MDRLMHKTGAIFGLYSNEELKKLTKEAEEQKIRIHQIEETSNGDFLVEYIRLDGKDHIFIAKDILQMINNISDNIENSTNNTYGDFIIKYIPSFLHETLRLDLTGTDKDVPNDAALEGVNFFKDALVLEIKNAAGIKEDN